MTTEEWKTRERSIHGDKYDLSKVVYNGSKSKVCIVCPKHGEFWQEANSHLKGCGCPKCNQSHLENEVSIFLNNNNVVFERQKTFNGLKNKKELYCDFYLPKYNCVIECQGEQHYRPVAYWGGYNSFLKRKKCDEIKYNYLNGRGIKVIYFTHLEIKDKENKCYIFNINDLKHIFKNERD